MAPSKKTIATNALAQCGEGDGKRKQKHTNAKNIEKHELASKINQN
jgi:hypothetical protein